MRAGGDRGRLDGSALKGGSGGAARRAGPWILAFAAVVASLAGGTGTAGAHDPKWGTGGVLHDYTLRFCARRDTPDVTHSGVDDYYKVRFEYRFKDVGYEVNHAVHHSYHGVPWSKWGADADIHVASQYTGEWQCRGAKTHAVLAGHGKSHGHGDFVNGRVVTENGNTIEIDIDWWVANQARSVCVWGVFTGATCLGSLCWGGSWTTSIRSNCR